MSFISELNKSGLAQYVIVIPFLILGFLLLKFPIIRLIIGILSGVYGIYYGTQGGIYLFFVPFFLFFSIYLLSWYFFFN